MRDETLIEPFAAQEIYCDGFTSFKVRNGNMSCVGYRLHDADGEGQVPRKEVVIRLIFPKDCAPAAIVEAQAALTSPPAESDGLWLRKAH